MPSAPGRFVHKGRLLPLLAMLAAVLAVAAARTPQAVRAVESEERGALHVSPPDPPPSHVPARAAEQSREGPRPRPQPPPRRSAAYEAARAALPAHFREYETRRFVILSDAAPAWTREQGERLERAWHQFERFCRRLEIDPGPLRHRLVCVLFEDYQQFVPFAAGDGVHARWAAGYYSPEHDRIVFYNVQSNPQLMRARRDLEAMHPPPDWEHLRRIDREHRRLEDHAHTMSAATTIHEAIHQLLFHTGVQSGHVQYPLWISEGLASAFETAAPNMAFGPDHEYQPRREAFTELLAADELLPLGDLVVLTDPGDAEVRQVSAIYHQSYALVTWMCRFRRAELRAYLDAMRSEPPGEITPQRHLEIFQSAFGEVAQLERAWLRSENRR